jgi:hypothetical protein
MLLFYKHDSNTISSQNLIAESDYIAMQPMKKQVTPIITQYDNVIYLSLK